MTSCSGLDCFVSLTSSRSSCSMRRDHAHCGDPNRTGRLPSYRSCVWVTSRRRSATVLWRRCHARTAPLSRAPATATCRRSRSCSRGTTDACCVQERACSDDPTRARTSPRTRRWSRGCSSTDCATPTGSARGSRASAACSACASEGRAVAASRRRAPKQAADNVTSHSLASWPPNARPNWPPRSPRFHPASATP